MLPNYWGISAVDYVSATPVKTKAHEDFDFLRVAVHKVKKVYIIMCGEGGFHVTYCWRSLSLIMSAKAWPKQKVHTRLRVQK